MSHVVEFVVIGLPQSGKTTFVKTISHATQWHNDDPADWFFGALPVDDGLTVHFMEPPRMQEFDFMWMREMVEQSDVDGYIVMMDSTNPQRFGRAVSIVQTILAYHAQVPVVIAANKQDVNGAWRAADIRMGLKIPDFIPVMDCVASEVEMVKEPVLELLYRVLDAG